MNFLKRKYYQLLLKYLKLTKSSDVQFVKAQYFYKTNQKLNLEQPIEFAEKIQWLKLYYYTERFQDYVDKYEVRAIVKEKIGAQYLNDIHTVYSAIEDIIFDELPQQFVLKGTHGSGYNVIVDDKSKLDWNSTRKEIKSFLSRNYYDKCRERIYRTIPPRMISEKYLNELDGGHIIDYKYYCFGGVPKYILIKAFEDGKMKNCFYDLEWNKIQPDSTTKEYLKRDIDKPSVLNEMTEVAKKLSDGFPFLRVDLYAIGAKVYFGELTFLPNGGWKRIVIERFNKEFGDLIVLPEANS
ncbi:hypothetical protein A9Q87_07190 [Flavobacteriales bacterium 34_180_T64]|nr:hypothetical protein A9Q87_07190 [Flavobacteriales bacterium 34_180_T64]